MSQQKIRVQDVVEQWLGAWWQWLSPMQSLLQGPIFNAYLEDAHEAYRKALTYWGERPELLRERMSDWAVGFTEVFGRLDTDHCEDLELLANIQAAQKTTAANLLVLISQTEVLNDHEISLLQFTLRQMMAVANPQNSICSNPKILQKVIETEGQSLIAGAQKYRQDAEASTFGLRVQRSDAGSGPIGKTIATTRGAVIFQNELMQLIHYEAAREQQSSVPLLLVPSCISRFYILDLLPENSFVRWLCEQGHDVYMISWINPNQTLKHAGLDDYIGKGCLAAIDVVIRFTRVERINMLGYCMGGLIASIAAGTGQGKDKIVSLTLLATLLDYRSPGELGIFVSPRMLKALKREIEAEGLLKAEILSLIFTLLREEKALWSPIRKRYFLGESLSFDALAHWGQDGVQLPCRMALDYLGLFYRKNCLSTNGRYHFGDESVSLAASRSAKYVLACERDHIAPAGAVMDGSELLGGDIRRVIASGGHAGGVINHPLAKRGKYQVNGSNIGHTGGSWWNDWRQWVAAYRGDKVEARPCATGDFPAIEPAPGKFVCS